MLPPYTLVDSASMMLDRSSPLKSEETSGSSETPRMPFIGPAAAARNASSSSSVVVSFSMSATKSTTETVDTGTRMAMPSNLPSSSGMTRATALAAPVVVGMMFMAAARARRRSLCGKSRMRWSLVYAWTVVITPRMMPKLSFTTLAAGARQFVVQDALETISCLAGSYCSWFTPRTIVMSGPLAGAVMMTFFAPACRCMAAFSRSRNTPVDSMTMSMPRSPQGNWEGSRWANTLISLPSTTKLPFRTSTVPGYRP